MAFKLVVIGASRGGLRALKVLLESLPGDFPLSLAVVLHRGKESDEQLSGHLQKCCRLPVTEVEDKEAILAGHVYLAPPDYHLLVEGDHFTLSTDAPVWYARPSIDILFESAAEAYDGKVVGVILTGANQDGAQGLAVIKKRGGLAVVLDPATAESPVMPEAAIAATAVDKILPIEEIGTFLIAACGNLSEIRNLKP